MRAPDLNGLPDVSRIASGEAAEDGDHLTARIRRQTPVFVYIKWATEAKRIRWRIQEYSVSYNRTALLVLSTRARMFMEELLGCSRAHQIF